MDQSEAVKQGKEYSVRVTGTGNKGDGVAHINGMAVFVRGGKVGDSCRILILRVESTYAVAEIVAEGS